MFIEKLGSKPELLPSIGVSVTEFLKQAPAHDTRLFIWALEEHRDQYDPFHSILDEYFDMMGTYSLFHYSDAFLSYFDSESLMLQRPGLCFSDGHCAIIQKSNENKNVSFKQCQHEPIRL